MNLRAGDVLAIGGGESEVTRDRLEAVAGQVAAGEVVAQDGVERVDQLAARGDEARAPAGILAERNPAYCLHVITQSPLPVHPDAPFVSVLGQSGCELPV